MRRLRWRDCLPSSTPSSATGIITTSRERRTAAEDADRAVDEAVASTGRVRFRFVPFSSPAPGHHTAPEYL